MRSAQLRVGLLCLGILCAVVGAPRWGHAQADPSDATLQAQRLFSAALAAKRAEDPARALCLMERARAAWPNPAFSFNVAQLQRELGMCSEARENYRAFLAHERDAARRQQAQFALAELAHCTPIPSKRPSDAESARCSAWADAVSSAGPERSDARPSRLGPANTRAVVAPDRVANSPRGGPEHARSSPLTAADPAPPTRQRVPRYLPWIFYGAGVLSGGLAGYQLTQISAAERDIGQAANWTPELSAREQDGRNAQTLFWVFSGAGALALAGALVLAIWSADDPPPRAAASP